MDEQEKDTRTQRERLVGLLEIEAPGSDFTDDEILFSQIIDDYADYARLLTENHEITDRLNAAEERLAAAEASLSHYDEDIAAAELRGRNSQIETAMANARPASDGVPCLQHGVINGDLRTTSFFELAKQ